MNRPVRAQIRRVLPADVFAPRPLRALLVPVWAAVALAASATVIFAGLPWWVDVALSLVIAQAFGGMGFAAHEILHGSTVRNRRLQDVLGWVGFLPFMVSPTLWREWHNRRHHSHANRGHADPDHFGHVSRYRKGGVMHGAYKLLPGSGSLISAAFHFYWFTFHNFFNLLVLSKLYRRFNRRPAFIEAAVAVLFWVGAITAGTWVAGWEVVLISVVPMMLGNALVMGYISTNHMMRPELDHDEPVDNSMSLEVPWIVDLMHGWFSHHVEHHLFPSMSPAQAPRIKAWLLQNTPERYVSPPWYKALWWLYRTPRPHDGANVLADPFDDSRRVDLDRLTAELRDSRFERLAPGQAETPDPEPGPGMDDAPESTEEVAARREQAA